MIDHRLYDLLHNTTDLEIELKPTLPKDRFQMALEDAVRADIKSVLEDKDPSSCMLIPLKVQQEQLERECLEAVDLPDLQQYLTVALAVLEKNERCFINEEDHQKVLTEINAVRNQFRTLDLHSLENESLAKALSISSEAQAMILQVAIQKFSEENYADALAIFALLTTLEGNDPEYWYRLGLAAQRMELYDLAIRAYQTTSELIPEFAGAKIFASQCYVEMSQEGEAMIELEKAKKSIKDNVNAQHEWEEYILDIEHLLALNQKNLGA